jgi:proteasome lid subunit RPN8/RPN11
MHFKCTITELRRLFSGLLPGRRRRKQDDSARHMQEMPVMKWTQTVYQRVLRDIGGFPPERGGILLGPVGELMATHFVLDETGSGTSASWTIGHVQINELLRKHVPLGLDMKAFVHSHPSGMTSLSGQDIADFRKPFAKSKHESLAQVWAPLVVDGQIYPYILYREQPEPVPARLVLC